MGPRSHGIVGIMLVLGACRSPGGTVREPADSGFAPVAPIPYGDPPLDGPSLLDLTPTEWRAAPGWSISSVRMVGDLNVDGHEDAAVVIGQDSDWQRTYTTLIVHGPLRASPAGGPSVAATLAPTWGILGIGHTDLDGLPDLIVSSWAGDALVVSSPLSGPIPVVEVGVPPPGMLRDVNLDGMLDALVASDAETRALEITFGPSSRWRDGPDVTIAPSCARADDDAGWSFLADAWPDVTGDGVPEVYIGPFGDRGDCGPWAVRLPSSGSLDPATDPRARRSVIPDFVVVRDQTSDGRPDVQVIDDGISRILATPVDIRSDGSLVSATAWEAGSGVITRATDLDFDFDGVADFMGRKLGVGTYALTIVPGGPGFEGALPGESGAFWTLPRSTQAVTFWVDGAAYFMPAPHGEQVTSVPIYELSGASRLD